MDLLKIQKILLFLDLFDETEYVIQSKDYPVSDYDAAFHKALKTELSSDTSMSVMNVTPDVKGMSDGSQPTLITDTIDKTLDTSLAQFLARPVLINTTTWTEGGSYTLSIQPWHLFFNSTPIKKKIDNYAYIRCNLKVRFMISASPFYYGAAQVAYEPLPGYAATVTDFGGLKIVPYSQRPNITLMPQSSAGGTLTLPFLYYKEWLKLTSAADLQAMGTITGTGYTNLLNANSVVGDNCTVQVFAWAEDVELSGSTINLAVQSKDEYIPNGVISKPASAVAYYAGKLGGWPIIGNFATATSIAAGAISSIASIFGYTNVPNIVDVCAYRPTSNPLLATTDISCPYEKLTLDSKNELTIDQSAYGVTSGDQLSISSIVTRPSYLTQFTWGGADAAETRLFSCRVSPSLHNLYVAGTNYTIYGTPMWLVANMFQYWRGDIKFRFQVVASKFHRGKLRITWDPLGDLTATSDSYTQAYSKIVDITEENDIELIIPYNQQTAYSEIPDLSAGNAQQFGSGALTLYDGDNGMLSVRVLNVQTSPIATADIKVLVWVEAMPNMEFASPVDIDANMNAYQIQSKDEEFSPMVTVPLGTTLGSEPKHLNLNYFGEKIVSLRTLIRRANHVMGISLASTFTGYTLLQSIFARLPLYPGYDPEGIHTTLVGPFPYNFVHWTTLNWVSQCFVGIRGSVLWNINPSGEVYHGNFYVNRPRTTLTQAAYIQGFAQTAASESAVAREIVGGMGAGQCGASVTNGRTQAGLAISVPMYSRYKFLPTAPEVRTLGDFANETNIDSVSISTYAQFSATNTGARAPIHYYAAAGTDMDFVFFLNVPEIYYYARPDAAL